MYLHPTNLHLGHNSFLKPLIEVVLILDKLCWSTLRSCEAPFFFFFYLRLPFKMLEATTTPSRPQPVVTAHSDHVTKVVKEVTSALDAMKQQKGKYLGKNVHRFRVWGEEELNRLIKTQKKGFWKTVHVNITLSLSPKPEGKIQSFTQVYSTTSCTELQSFISAGEATIEII